MQDISTNNDTHFDAFLLKDIKKKWPSLTNAEKASELIQNCFLYNQETILWILNKADTEELEYDDFLAFKLSVDNNHLDVVKAFINKGFTIPESILPDILFAASTKHHLEMACYFIDNLKLDIASGPEILHPYLMAKNLTPMEYLRICPSEHKSACLNLMNTSATKSWNDEDYSNNHNPLIK